MNDHMDADARIALSVRKFREWQWMSSLSADPENVVDLLRKEAKELIALGTSNPGKARNIGKLVVAYHRLITSIKDSQSPQRAVE